MKNPKVYFPGLNGLRIIAALFLFLAHNETVKQIRGLNNLSNTHFYSTAGDAGVSLFFCISGFLITSLLLAEADITKTISLKDFYIRRALRIWPLYYFILIITLLVIPALLPVKGFNLENKITPAGFILYLSFLPYIANALFAINFPAAVLWSVGVEETFYLIWPVLIKYRKEVQLNFFIALIISFLLIKLVIDYCALHTTGFMPMATIFDHLRLECMLIGSAFAYLLRAKSKPLTFMYNNYTFAISFILLLIYHFIGFGSIYQYVNPIIVHVSDPAIYSLLCCIIIINSISRKSIYTVLEYPPIYELGKISYGIYLYHLICLMICIVLFEKLNISHINAWLSGTIAFALTVFVSYLSYYGFESRFLKLKGKFTHVHSGENAKER